jgi:hypothetical protein
MRAIAVMGFAAAAAGALPSCGGPNYMDGVTGVSDTSMPTDCYFDRGPGGCNERAEKLQKDRKLHRWFYSRIKGFNHPEALPPMCLTDEQNPDSNPRTVPKLTAEQMQACIDAVDAFYQAAQQKQIKADQQAWARSRWERVEADNGAVYAVETTTIMRGPGGVTARICALDNDRCMVPPGMVMINFDCRGHYNPWGGAYDHLAPSRSVIARLGSIACSGAQGSAQGSTDGFLAISQ